MARMASSMAAAATAGMSVFVATGDHGAYDCVDQDRSDLSVSVDSPASDVNAIGVGGTFLTMLEDGSVIDEVAWEEPLTGWAPGGGLSVYNRRPAWQAGLGVDNDHRTACARCPTWPPPQTQAAASSRSVGRGRLGRRDQRGRPVLGGADNPDAPAR